MAPSKSSFLRCSDGFFARARNGRRELMLLRFDAQVRRMMLVIGAGAVFLLLDLENVDGATKAREQILAVVGVEEFRESFDFAGDHEQIVL